MSEEDAGMGKENEARPKLFLLWEQLEKLAATDVPAKEEKVVAKK